MRETFPLAVHLFLERGNQVLLLRRFNTGYEDGNYSVAAGHVERGEDVYAAMLREAAEELGLTLRREDLHAVQVMHRLTERGARVDYFFTCANWDGEPENREPGKCDELRWADRGALPENTVGYVRAALGFYHENAPFTLYGWPP